jgi:hypothetical protein
MGLYWAVIGWIMLLVFTDVFVIIIVSTVAVLSGAKPAGANAMLRMRSAARRPRWGIFCSVLLARREAGRSESWRVIP